MTNERFQLVVLGVMAAEEHLPSKQTLQSLGNIR